MVDAQYDNPRLVLSVLGNQNLQDMSLSTH